MRLKIILIYLPNSLSGFPSIMLQYCSKAHPLISSISKFLSLFGHCFRLFPLWCNHSAQMSVLNALAQMGGVLEGELKRNISSLLGSQENQGTFTLVLTLALCTSVDNTVSRCAWWWSLVSLRYKPVWVGFLYTLWLRVPSTLRSHSDIPENSNLSCLCVVIQKSIIYITEETCRCKGSLFQSQLFDGFQGEKKLTITRDKGESISAQSVCSKYWPEKRKYLEHSMCQNISITPEAKIDPNKSKVSFNRTLVNKHTVSKLTSKSEWVIDRMSNEYDKWLSF